MTTNNQYDYICKQQASPDDNCKHDTINCTYRPLSKRCGFISETSEHTLENAACIQQNRNNNTGRCQNVETMNGEIIYCGIDDYSGDCVEVAPPHQSKKLEDLCYRRRKDCDLINPSPECTTLIQEISLDENFIGQSYLNDTKNSNRNYICVIGVNPVNNKGKSQK